MTHDEYRAWATDYCTTFGLFERREAEMVLSWFEALDAAGFVIEDLERAASTLLHPGPAPQFRSDHLRLIQIHAGASASARTKAAERNEEQNGGPSSCSECAGSGWMAVPHPSALVDGRMVKGTTIAVTCRCVRGCTTAASAQRPSTIAGYEIWNPNWRRQLERWRAGQVALTKAMNEARGLDRTAGKLVNRIAQAFALPNGAKT